MKGRELKKNANKLGNWTIIIFSFKSDETSCDKDVCGSFGRSYFSKWVSFLWCTHNMEKETSKGNEKV